MKTKSVGLAFAFATLLWLPTFASRDARAEHSCPRVIASSDIGGTDFDDFQSMVHLLLCADRLEIEGLVSSPYGGGRKEQILKVIDCYERDYPNLKTYSDRYPAPAALRAITKQGALKSAGWTGVSTPTEGSEWIVKCARRPDVRPLHIIIWGGIDDLAQALHDAPDILPRLRVYFIGGPNKKWSANAYAYIEENFPKLWIVEANATYFGWFVGGNQAGDLDNNQFVATHIAGRGALGEFFAHCISLNAQTKSTIKMGDSPSIGWLLHGNLEDPSQPGWGGQFVHAWERPRKTYDRLTTAADEMEQYGVLELVLPLGETPPENPAAQMQIENQSLPGFIDAKGKVHFRFSPKDPKTYQYVIHANIPSLDGQAGALTALPPAPAAARHPSARLPNWWTDNPDPALADAGHLGAKTVNRWREDFLRDFAVRLDRCKSPFVGQSGPKS